MTCKKCGNLVADGQLFCTVCGERAEVTKAADSPRTEGGYANSGNMNYSSQNGGYQGYQGNPDMNYSNNGYYAAGAPQYMQYNINDKAPTVKDYLKWTLLYPLTMLVPGIGFIIYIVICFKFAFDNTYVGRANFFKASLIAQAVALAVSAVVFIFIFIIFGSVAFTGIEMMEELYPEIFNEFEFGYNTLKMFF